MRKSFHFAICLLVVLAVVASGCGSSTKTASTAASASATGNQSPQTVGQSTSSNEAQQTSKASKPKVAEVKPKGQGNTAEVKRRGELKAAKQRAEAKARAEAAKRARLEAEAAKPQSRKEKPYPESFNRRFIARCEAAKGSPSICACVASKQRLSKVETGRALAELLALELALEKGATIEQALGHSVPLPKVVRGNLQLCKSSGSA
jgi:hypothetical protein